jgi:hypothetical protein
MSETTSNPCPCGCPRPVKPGKRFARGSCHLRWMSPGERRRAGREGGLTSGRSRRDACIERYLQMDPRAGLIAAWKQAYMCGYQAKRRQENGRSMNG